MSTLPKNCPWPVKVVVIVFVLKIVVLANSAVAYAQCHCTRCNLKQSKFSSFPLKSIDNALKQIHNVDCNNAVKLLRQKNVMCPEKLTQEKL